MRILITGGTGFVGKNLSEYLLKKNHHVTAIGTSKTHPMEGHDHFLFISGDTRKRGKWQNSIHQMDAIINLTGKNIFHYWTKKYKKGIYDSRILTTRNIVEALSKNQKAVLLSASAAGYFGNRGDEKLTENDSPGNDFLANVCKDWEKEAFMAESKGIRTAVMRFGVILGKNGGALKKMVPAFKYFFGGPLGNGRQWFPWIHMTDLLMAIEFLLNNQTLKGAFNFTAPVPIRQKEFAEELGKTLHRPSFIQTPSFILRIFAGELGNALLSSQKATPTGLLNNGFHFQYPKIDAAFGNLL